MTNDHGRIEGFVDTVIDPQTGVVDIAHHYRFLDMGKSIVGRSRIRFIDQDHLMRLLAAANLIPITWYGDWDRTPLTPTSREFIVVTCRADRRRRRKQRFHTVCLTSAPSARSAAPGRSSRYMSTVDRRN
jgi:hypothetical protein